MQMEGGTGGSGCHWHMACKTAHEKAERINKSRNKHVLRGESPTRAFSGQVVADNRFEMTKEAAFLCLNPAWLEDLSTRAS